MREAWQKTRSRRVGDYRSLQVRRDDYRLEGMEHDFYVLEMPDWVNVIALTEGERLVFVRQFRVGIERLSLEIPGGVVDEGERPIDAATRELAEETGYVPARVSLLGALHPNPALQGNRIYTFLAEGCRLAAEPQPDATEELEGTTLPVDEAVRLLRTGEIEHALVAVAFLHWRLHPTWPLP